MKKKVELIIGEGVNQISLDLTENSISIALQYSIDDIRDIDKKSTNYSKTITLPGTKKNNNAFGSLFDVNSTFDEYNPNLKIDARIVVDSSPVLEGYLQLTKVNKMNNADLQGNKISYEVIVFDDSIDFIQTLGDKLVEDLNFVELNHIYEKTSVENAWNTHTYQDVYQYPLMDKDTANYQTEDFKPAFYHKAILLEIADNAGYSLEGSFMTTDDSGVGPNTTYEREVIMWDGDTPKISDAIAASREYRAGTLGSSTQLGIYTHRSRNLSSNGQIPPNNVNFNTITPNPPFFDNTGNYTFNLPGGSLLDYSQWQCTNTGQYDFDIQANFTVQYNKTTSEVGDLMKNGSPTNSDVFAVVVCEITDVDTGFIYASGAQNLGKYQSLSSSQMSKSITNDVSLTMSSKVIPLNAKIKPVYKLASSHNFGWGYSNSGYTGIERRKTTVRVSLNHNPTPDSFWANKVQKVENVVDGSEIELSLYLPKEIKQKDIISDIIRRYNVYIRKHPTKNKTLILESRDDFYDNNPTVIDWTQKKDYSSQDKIAFLSDLQNKEILFTYKEANDIVAADGGKYNETYSQSTGDIYGQKLINFNNDFVKGVKKIESIFSTTPLVFRGDVGNNVIIPTVSTSETKRKPVLCYWGGMIPVKDENDDSKVLSIKWGTDPVITYTTYPYAGHWDNPYNPTIDIHFGDITFEYYTNLKNVSDNNLFNNYWRNYIEQISNGRLITSKFYLNETDINFIKDNLNSRIFVKDSYYVINKITDYKPLEDGLTTVELLRIEKGSTFEPVTTLPVNIVNFVTMSPNDQFITSVNDTRTGPFRSNISNTTRSRDVVMIGDNNFIGSDTTGIVNGNNNTIFDDTTSVNIQGNNNSVDAGLTNVMIIGDNQIVTQSNTTIINGTTISEGSPLNGLWERGDGDDSLILPNIANTVSSNYGSIATGVQNSIDVGADYSSIIGGAGNSILTVPTTTTSEGSSIIGGESNEITGARNGLLGGSFNVITSDPLEGNSTILGGALNNITGQFSGVLAGNTNTVSGDYSTITGGSNNTIETTTVFTSIIGGGSNTIRANSQYSSIIGSNIGEVNGSRSIIVGGESPTILGNNSVTNGGQNSNINGNNSFTGGGFTPILVGNNSAIIAGDTNSLTGNNSVIVGGNNITATQDNTAYLPKLAVTETYIPTGVTDTNGVLGEISYDGDYIYVKTASGWLKSNLGVDGSVTADNGLSISATTGDVELGGGLTKPTTILGNGQFLQLGNPVSKLSMIAFTNFCSMTAGVNTGVTDTTATLTLNTAEAGLISGKDSKVRLGTSTGGTSLNILLIDGDETTFTDNATTPKGIQYDADYSTTFVNRSLVDKEYVDDEISSLNTTSFTPSSTLDPTGSLGEITFDSTYMYYRTASGWGRVVLDYAF